MADGGYRGFQQHGAGPYYQQHNQHYQHPSRHLARNGSPVNNGRNNYANDTPSPSRSPVSQASSHNHFGMYNQGHQQGQHVMMNGGHHQRFMQPGVAGKYQHQGFQHSSAQQNHHNQQNHIGGHGAGHQHTFSSGTMSNATPHFTPSDLHNGPANNNPMANVNYNPNTHWERQMLLAAESRQAHSAPHHHCKKEGNVSRVQKSLDQGPSEDLPEEREEERNRAMAISETSRQDWNSLDFSGQGLRALAPALFSYDFLTKLYLDHNKIQRLDPAIAGLRKLTHLDISNNQIMELPQEIGMLVNLKELLVIDNDLRTLPYELGHLFRLEMLGIEGNPLDEDYRAIIVNHGTKSLITQLRENAGPGMSPRAREIVEFDDAPASEVLSVVSYNILCDRYATASQYGYTPSADLAWSYRRTVILKELRGYDADIVCLQEVDRENYDDFSQKELRSSDYKGVFWPKSRAKTMAEKEAKLVDGCATLYKANKYILLDKMLIDFANTAINRPDMKGEHDTFNRVMPRDHIAVAVFLENRMTGSRMIVVNAHIFWDPAFPDVKLVQVAIMMEQISKQAERWSKHAPCRDKTSLRPSENDGEIFDDPTAEPMPSLEYASGPDIPLIMCGDFNSDTTTGVYELITTGSLTGDHRDVCNRSYGNFTKDGMTHPFKLKSAYTTREELSFTNYTPNFSGVIDYIWYSHPSLQVRELLGNVDDEYLRRVPGFPNHHFPSDHIALKADFSVKQMKPVETNGSQREWERSHI